MDRSSREPSPSPTTRPLAVGLTCLALTACSDTKNGSNDAPSQSARPKSAVSDAGAKGLADASPGTDASTIENASSSSSDSTDHVRFTEVYVAVIQQKCAPCHTTTGDDASGVSEGQLDMTTQQNAYANLVNVPAGGSKCKTPFNYLRVKPNAIDDSILWDKINPGGLQPCGARMPMGRAALSQAELGLIQQWIVAGAKND